MKSIRSHTILLQCLAVAMAGSSCKDSAGPRGGVREHWYEAQSGVALARPAVLASVVYFGTNNGEIIARDAATGVQRWVTKVGTDPLGVGGANIIARNGVVVAAVTTYTVGLDAQTGQPLWRYEAPPDTTDRPPGAPLVPGRVIGSRIDADDMNAYIPAWGASISAVDLRTGALRWVWKVGILPGDTAVSGVFRSGSMSVRLGPGGLYATMWHDLDRDGRTSEAWVLRLGELTGIEFFRTRLPDKGFGAFITGAPAVSGAWVIVNTQYARTYGIDRVTGALIWNFATPAPTLLAYSEVEAYGDAVYVDGGDNHIYALSGSNGAVLWSSSIPDGAFTDLLVTERRVAVTNNRTLYFLDRQTGAQITAVTQPRTTDPHFQSPPIFDNGLVFVAVNGAAWCFEEP
jgi:outer membrane protein assembly factor BamB